MIEIFNVNYDLLSENRSAELFSLRKKTFKDRLDWIVNCKNNMEFDEYDNSHTTYLFGVCDNLIICSMRFIETRYNNMITGTFKHYFNKINIPEGNYLEASRLFIDKQRVRSFQLHQHPISSILFLSMINYARDKNYEGIYAIISHPMLIIFQRSGWKISIVEQGMSEKNQKIYLIYMPVDNKNQQTLINRIQKHELLSNKNGLDAWPLSLSIRENRSDELQLDPKPYGMFSIGNA
ncbi:acyl homoserine lactone synthase [Gibbsiella quercinecans]|uniref:Acyl-homoserine-lactone synthase n=1 Tax=Gibbsiella quercinecans TaxID=929813 RepID=A0A250B1B6_9GAMM|nr:acyl-homoserine-lactone synthase [Gibbsiella quercinecans]ATA19856.1 acyl-homoserine-lactone synthase [Gibbsiella quercinecans]TCT89701.1 acyl homoserine lactone synthase [Gibbsiella quercinecans]